MKLIHNLKREYRELAMHPLPVMVAFVCPILVWLLLAYIFSNGVVRKIPIVVLDYSESKLSRNIINALDGSEALKVISVSKNKTAAVELMKRQEAFFIINLEKDLDKKVISGEKAYVKVITNGGALLYGKVGYKTIAQVITAENIKINTTKLIAAGLDKDEAYIRSYPIRSIYRVPGNPFFDYGKYLIPAIALAMLQMSVFFSTLWTFHKKIQDPKGLFIPKKGDRFEYLLAHMIPIFTVNLAATLVLFLLILPMSGLWFGKALISFIPVLILFISACMGFGAFLSISMKNVTMGAQIILVVASPSFIFSGYTFPRWAMPQVFNWIAEVFPLTHLLESYFSIFMYGRLTTNGLIPLVIINIVLWFGVFLFSTAKFVKFRHNYVQE
jgi:ABC-2 type transport system permease protein